jgi:hypothetical protein
MNLRQLRSCSCEACSVRRHIGEVVACVFVELMEMRSTCAECRSLCMQCRGHLSGGCDGGIALSENFTVDVSVWAVVVSEVLRANQDSFLECFPPASESSPTRDTRSETLGPGFPPETDTFNAVSGTAHSFTIDETRTIDASCYCRTRTLLHVPLTIMIAHSATQNPHLSPSERAANASLSLASHPN